MPGFPPIMGHAPRVLVLGSMPGQQSLVEAQYYANPRNCFWWIMSQLFAFDSSLSYQQRSLALSEKHVCVWDVLHDCERPGSLDSAIVKESEQVNDFSTLFDQHPTINKVIFNGRAAQTIFDRHLKALKLQISQHRRGFQWYLCPSTSPAHASMSKQQKLEVWRAAILNQDGVEHVEAR